MEVSVRDLKNRLSEYLRRVQRGERLIVTERTRPIAELGPLRKGSLDQEDRLSHLEELGELMRPGKRRAFRAVRAVKVRGRPLSQTILEDRR